MSLCMTLLVRDEAAIVRENIEYHLNRGVDKIIATDNLSQDETTDILRNYEKQGVLHYVYEEKDDYSQDKWVTRMAHIAVEVYAAEWVIHSDADEFWWCREDKSLKSVLSDVLETIDGLVVQRSNFLTLKDENLDLPFYKRMIYRQKNSTNPLGKPLPPKVCHRGSTEVLVHQGNHRFSFYTRQSRIINSDALIIWHFQYRGFEDYRNKIVLGGAAYERNNRFPSQVGGTWRKLLELHKKDRLFEYYQNQCVSTSELNSMLDSGEAVRDTDFAEYMDEIVAPRFVLTK